MAGVTSSNMNVSTSPATGADSRSLAAFARSCSSLSSSLRNA
jgi:hypothetical protein